MKRSRLKPMSRKRASKAAEYIAFKLALHAADNWVCQWCYGRHAHPLDPHHTRKPRAKYLMDMDTVITLCRFHHDMTEWPYAKGRIYIGGTRSTGWIKQRIWAKDKLAVPYRITEASSPFFEPTTIHEFSTDFSQDIHHAIQGRGGA